MSPDVKAGFLLFLLALCRMAAAVSLLNAFKNAPYTSSQGTKVLKSSL